MSRLKEVKTPEGSTGWQWDVGPVFLGDIGRTLAVDYGKTIQRLEELEKLAALQLKQDRCRRRLKVLEKMKEKEIE